MKFGSIVAALAVLGGLTIQGHGQSLAPARVAVPYHIESGGGGIVVYGAPSSAATSEVNRIMGQLREATDDAKKAELTKQLETAVTKLFDEDLKTRETELTKLEERLKKLKDQIERRKKAKADIIQLQLKVLANEAEGLGFSRGSSIEAGTAIYTPSGANVPVPARAIPAKR